MQNRDAFANRAIRTMEIIKCCMQVLIDGIPAGISDEVLRKLYPPDPSPPPIDLIRKFRYHSREDIHRELRNISMRFGIVVKDCYGNDRGIEFILQPPPIILMEVNGCLLRGYNTFLIASHLPDGGVSPFFHTSPAKRE